MEEGALEGFEGLEGFGELKECRGFGELGESWEPAELAAPPGEQQLDSLPTECITDCAPPLDVKDGTGIET